MEPDTNSAASCSGAPLLRHGMTGGDGVRARSVISIAVAVFLSTLVAVGSALIVIGLARPSQHELQRAAFDEFGLSPSLLDLPGVKAIADDVTDRVADRVLDESKPSLALGAIAGIVTGGMAALVSAAVLVREPAVRGRLRRGP